MTALHVNVYAENYGWLFEDLKRHFLAGEAAGRRITTSCVPDPVADRWIALRTSETGRSPDPANTMACIHDLFDEPGLYGPGGTRAGAGGAGALWLCHPGARAILARDGIDLSADAERHRILFERPIGALAMFTPRTILSERFTVGWIGRNDPVKRLAIFEAAMARLALTEPDTLVMLVGEDIGGVADAVRATGLDVSHHDRRVVPIEHCPRLYQAMDVLVLTSATEGQPLALFESLAYGVPAITSPVGWAPYFAARAPDLVRLAEGPEAITTALSVLRRERAALFARRSEIAALAAPWRLEGWVAEMLDVVAALPAGRAR